MGWHQSRIWCVWRAAPPSPATTPSTGGCAACLDWWSWSQQHSPPPCSCHRATLTLIAPQHSTGDGGGRIRMGWHQSHLVCVACLPTEPRSHTKHRWVRGLPGLVVMVAAALATAVQSPCSPNPKRITRPHGRTLYCAADHGTDLIWCLRRASPPSPAPTPSTGGRVACLGR